MNNDPIVFVWNGRNSPISVSSFKFPFSKCKRGEWWWDLGLAFDIRINTEWHRNVDAKYFSVNLPMDKQYTILVKPSGDKYLRGWGRWFEFRCWDCVNFCRGIHDNHKPKHKNEDGEYEYCHDHECNFFNSIPKVISNPQFAHDSPEKSIQLKLWRQLKNKKFHKKVKLLPM